MSATWRRTTVGGFDAIVLENRRVRAVIIPTLGGRVWELEDRLLRRQWIWHREDVQLATASLDADYDSVWAGGWEELFPNDARAAFGGRNLPDHGEWWTLSWSVVECDVSNGVARLRLTADTTVVKTTCVKEFRLHGEEATLLVDYGIASAEPDPFHFLFKQHLPVSVNRHCELLLPSGEVEAVDTDFGSFAKRSGRTPWPHAADQNGRPVDISQVRDRASGTREFVYVRDISDGWCGVADRQAAASLRMTFDRRHFPSVWLFLTYGGWRGLYTAVLEPCSNVPKDLAEAVRHGQSARLAPGAEFRTQVAVTLAAIED